MEDSVATITVADERLDHPTLLGMWVQTLPVYNIEGFYSSLADNIQAALSLSLLAFFVASMALCMARRRPSVTMVDASVDAAAEHKV